MLVSDAHSCSLQRNLQEPIFSREAEEGGTRSNSAWAELCCMMSEGRRPPLGPASAATATHSQVQLNPESNRNVNETKEGDDEIPGLGVKGAEVSAFS